MSESVVILSEGSIHRVLSRIAHEIAERNEESRSVALVGVQSGGVHLAGRLAKLLEQIWGHPVPTGHIDVAMHRDDLNHKAVPPVHPTVIPFDLNDKTVVLVDDVLFRGRTVRAALDALNDFGRPKQVQLAVLIDRGHRELPIKADFVGKKVSSSIHERVDVRLKENGAEDVAYLERS